MRKIYTSAQWNLQYLVSSVCIRKMYIYFPLQNYNLCVSLVRNNVIEYAYLIDKWHILPYIYWLFRQFISPCIYWLFSHSQWCPQNFKRNYQVLQFIVSCITDFKRIKLRWYNSCWVHQNTVSQSVQLFSAYSVVCTLDYTERLLIFYFLISFCVVK